MQNACIRISEIMTVCIQEMKKGRELLLEGRGEGTCQSGGAVHFPQKSKGGVRVENILTTKYKKICRIQNLI